MIMTNALLRNWWRNRGGDIDTGKIFNHDIFIFRAVSLCKFNDKFSGEIM